MVGTSIHSAMNFRSIYTFDICYSPKQFIHAPRTTGTRNQCACEQWRHFNMAEGGGGGGGGVVTAPMSIHDVHARAKSLPFNTQRSRDPLSYFVNNDIIVVAGILPFTEMLMTS